MNLQKICSGSLSIYQRVILMKYKTIYLFKILKKEWCKLPLTLK